MAEENVGRWINNWKQLCLLFSFDLEEEVEEEGAPKGDKEGPF